MALPPGIRYSVLRNNIEVPLIPVDQLPFYIQGLPRELTPFRSHQEGWRSIGETQHPALPLSIRAPPHLQSSQVSSCTDRNFLPPDHDARKDLITTSQVSEPLTSNFPVLIAPADTAVGPHQSKSPPRHPASTAMDRYAATRSEGLQYTAHRIPNPSGVEPSPWKKEFCTHWIRTNSCDFMQQGCKYKHEMPGREKLKELGFAEIPKWYRDKTAISAGASSWLRPSPAQDDKGRRLSVESPASRGFRPSIIPGRSQPRASVLSDPLPPKADQVNDEMPNLIDLDDSSIVRVSQTPSLFISPVPGAVSFDAKAVVAQPLKQVTETLASLLRQEEPDEEKQVNALVDADLLTTVRPVGRQNSDVAVARGEGNDTFVLLPQTLSQSRMSGLSSGQEAKRENDSATEAMEHKHPTAKHSVTLNSGGKYNSKSSKPQQKRTPRLQKLAERSSASANGVGLARSQYATGKKPKEESAPSKGFERGSVQGGKDLHFEIVQHQRTVGEKEHFSKGTSSSGIQSWVAAGRIEAV